MLREKAIDKWKAYNSDLYSENQTYVLLLDNGKEPVFLPGTKKNVLTRALLRGDRKGL